MAIYHENSSVDASTRNLASGLTTNVRAIDLPCRLGGEEFVLMLPNAGRGQAASIVERLLARVRQARRVAVAGGARGTADRSRDAAQLHVS